MFVVLRSLSGVVIAIIFYTFLLLLRFLFAVVDVDAGSPQNNSRAVVTTCRYLIDVLPPLDIATDARNALSIGLTKLFVLAFILRNSRHVQHTTLVAKNLSKLGLSTIDVNLREGFLFSWL